MRKSGLLVLLAIFLSSSAAVAAHWLDRCLTILRGSRPTPAQSQPTSIWEAAVGETKVQVGHRELRQIGRLESGEVLAVGVDGQPGAETYVLWFLDRDPLQSRPLSQSILIPKLRRQPDLKACMTEAIVNGLRYAALNAADTPLVSDEAAQAILRVFPDPENATSYDDDYWQRLHYGQLSHRLPLVDRIRNLLGGQGTALNQEDWTVSFLRQVGMNVRLETNPARVEAHLNRGYPAIVSVGSRTSMFPYVYYLGASGSQSLRTGLELTDHGVDRNHSVLAVRPISDPIFEGVRNQVLVMDSGDGLYKLFSTGSLTHKDVMISAILIEPLRGPRTQGQGL